MICCLSLFFFFFFNDTATTEIYTLSLHDALPICGGQCHAQMKMISGRWCAVISARSVFIDRHRLLQLFSGGAIQPFLVVNPDRKSTRLNSSHSQISYAVFCLKKKKKDIIPYTAVV